MLTLPYVIHKKLCLVIVEKYNFVAKFLKKLEICKFLSGYILYNERNISRHDIHIVK